MGTPCAISVTQSLELEDSQEVKKSRQSCSEPLKVQLGRYNANGRKQQKKINSFSEDFIIG